MNHQQIQHTRGLKLITFMLNSNIKTVCLSNYGNCKQGTIGARYSRLGHKQRHRKMQTNTQKDTHTRARTRTHTPQRTQNNAHTGKPHTTEYTYVRKTDWRLSTHTHIDEQHIQTHTHTHTLTR